MHLETIFGFAVVGTIAFIVLGLPAFTIRRLVRNRRAGKRIRANVIILAAYVVFLAVTVAVAIPSFLKFQAPKHPGCGEARTNLGAIFTTQVEYFAEPNTEGVDFTLFNWAGETAVNSACVDGSTSACFPVGGER